MIDIPFWIAIVALLCGCYFAACSTAVRIFNRSRLSELLEKRGQSSRFWLFTDAADDLMLITGLHRSCLGLVVILAILYWVKLHLGWEAPLVQSAIAFAIAALLVSVFGVALPGSIARYRAEWLLAISSGPLERMYRFFRPLTRGLRVLDPIVRRIAGVDSQQSENAASQEVLSVVEEMEDDGNVDPAQKQMIEAVFELPSTTAGAIMTPRTEVQGLPLSASLEEVKAAIMRDGHSRVPIYDRTIDNIVGILFAKDLIRFLGAKEPFDLRSVLREPLMVPESKPVRELLAEFKTRKVHMAIVLDEYGGTAGLVTIEDIIEELVGEIRDEYDVTQDEPIIRRIDAHTLDVDARVRITDLAEELSITLPDDQDYDTVGGFVFSTLGHIPTTGEQFDYESARFTVTEAERTKVNRVRIEQVPPGGQPAALAEKEEKFTTEAQNTQRK